MPRLVSLAPLLAAALLLLACGGSEEIPSAARAAPAKPMRHVVSVPVPCAVGARPGYFVPGGRRLALLGCARLGVSGRRVDFSGSVTRIDGTSTACINPAYGARGNPGAFIPAICMLRPPLSRFAARDVSHPRQAVRGYELVIWGTAAAGTTAVSARFRGGIARAAVLGVRPKLARRLGERPFSLFVLELPLAAACDAITVRDDGATERIPPRRRLCPNRP
jgi:hypothetical protein